MPSIISIIEDATSENFLIPPSRRVFGLQLCVMLVSCGVSLRFDGKYVFFMPEALEEMKKQEEAEQRRRREEEEKEVQNRLRETKQREAVFAVQRVKPKLDEMKVHPAESKAAPEEKEEEKPALNAEQMASIARLKEEYRQLRKQPPSEENEKEMKKIKKEIARIMGRKKPKKPKLITARVRRLKFPHKASSPTASCIAQ